MPLKRYDFNDIVGAARRAYTLPVTAARSCIRAMLTALIAAASVCACAAADRIPPSSAGADPTTEALRAKVATIVVIYAENRTFDNLYGTFPRRTGLERGASTATAGRGRRMSRSAIATARCLRRCRRRGAVSPQRATTPVVTQAQSTGLPNAPFSIEHAFTAQSGVTLPASVVTRDLNHRFFEHQMQIDGGKNDQYAAWSDAGGLTMGYYDTSGSALYALARQYVLADQFLSGGVRRLVPEPSVPDLRLRAAVPECGYGSGQAVDCDTRYRRGRALPAAAHDGQTLTGVGARRAA